MSGDGQYERVALDENDAGNTSTVPHSSEEETETNYSLNNCLGRFALVLGIFVIGFVAGGTWAGVSKTRIHVETNGLLSPQSFIPESKRSPELLLQRS